MTQNQIRGLERAHWTDTAESVTETNPVDHVFESRTRPHSCCQRFNIKHIILTSRPIWTSRQQTTTNNKLSQSRLFIMTQVIKLLTIIARSWNANSPASCSFNIIIRIYYYIPAVSHMYLCSDPTRSDVASLS